MLDIHSVSSRLISVKTPVLLLPFINRFANIFVMVNLHAFILFQLDYHPLSRFRILINSFGSAIILPHFLHLVTSNGSYIGIKTLTLGSGVCSRKILFTSMMKRRFRVTKITTERRIIEAFSETYLQLYCILARLQIESCVRFSKRMF